MQQRLFTIYSDARVGRRWRLMAHVATGSDKGEARRSGLPLLPKPWQVPPPSSSSCPVGQSATRVTRTLLSRRVEAARRSTHEELTNKGINACDGLSEDAAGSLEVLLGFKQHLNLPRKARFVSRLPCHLTSSELSIWAACCRRLTGEVWRQRTYRGGDCVLLGLVGLQRLDLRRKSVTVGYI